MKTGKIESPGVVSVTDCGTMEDGRPYLVMELVRWPTLLHVLRNNTFTPTRAAQVGIQLATALHSAHGRGVLPTRRLNRRAQCQPTFVPAIVSQAGPLPPALEAIIRRALAKDPAHRHQSALALASDLRHAVSITDRKGWRSLFS